MKNNVFHLQIIPVKNILPHEEFDETRAAPLINRLNKEGCLSNPIIVAQFEKDKYLQLDGMNRLSAFIKMGIPTILTQLIDYNDQEVVELSSWIHLFSAGKEAFFDFLKADGNFLVKPGRLENVGHRYVKAEGLGRLCTLVCAKGEVYLISTNGKLQEKIKKLSQLVSFYKEKIIRDVLPSTPMSGDIDFLFREHKQCKMMMVFPTFTRHQIIEIVKSNHLFPPGVTRHIIKRRCLSVNAPLSLFKSGKSAVEQNQLLEELLASRRFRVYEEPTVYFE